MVHLSSNNSTHSIGPQTQMTPTGLAPSLVLNFGVLGYKLPCSLAATYRISLDLLSSNT